LKPDVLITGVVHHEVDDHLEATIVRLVEQALEVAEGADTGKDVAKVGDVVTAVAQR
jgi:hypothetical protein